jgi:eukaryotic-like serine/threonine-protein kinase
MTLASGSKFGTYNIGESIGVGGMGEVFRATDTKLERQVAIKVLPESFAEDADRIARFEREAKTLASLNHPNIAQIHDLEKQGDTTAIVMELVEGSTLAERIEEGPIPAEEALRIAKQLIDGLEAAHDRGIVHRDLKPANIKVKEDGSVKILDFGIAKPIDFIGSSGGNSPTNVTPAVTETGVIMGTAAYMSPEQAQGKFVDQRTDVWAFGCVLYEMLTGQPAFAGENVMLTLAKILANETDMESIPGMITPAVRHTLTLCLEKDPKKRIRHIGDVKLALEGKFDSLSPEGIAEIQTPPLKFWLKAIPVAVIVAVIASVGVYFQMQPTPGQVNRFSYILPAEQQYRNLQWNVFALSPDGRQFAYNTPDGIYLREMGELEARLIPGTQEGLRNLFFSPDSQSLAYFTANQLKRIAISGGAPVVIADTVLNIVGASWQEDSIFFGSIEGIYQVSANGGTPELIVDGNPGAAGSPELLPDGDTLIYTTGSAPRQIFAQSLRTGERTLLVEGGRDAHYVSSGHLVYEVSPGDGLFAVRFDLDTLTVSGGPVPLVQGVRSAGNSSSVNYDIADDGTLVYVWTESGDATNSVGCCTLTWVDRNGEEEAIDLPPRNYFYSRVSPDGQRLVLQIDTDIWVSDVNRPVLSRITTTDVAERFPLWAPDSQRVVFSVNTEGKLQGALADGTGNIETLLELPEPGLVSPGSWIPGEDTLLFTYGSSSVDPTISMLNLNPPNNDVPVWRPVIDRDAGASALDVAPEGDWVAYHADDTGQYGVYIERYPELGNRQLVSDADGGWGAWWSADGGEVYYRRLGDGAMMAVSVQTSPSLVIGTPEMLFESANYMPLSTPGEGAPSDKRWAVAPDDRFLMIKSVVGGSGGFEQIIVVQNWVDELQRLAPTE